MHNLYKYSYVDLDYISKYTKDFEGLEKHLLEKSPSWAVGCNFLDKEFDINGTYQPMLLMDWVIGDSLIDFISKNISNKKALSNLQKSIFDLSESLEKNQIGHGDIQPGNIVVL